MVGYASNEVGIFLDFTKIFVGSCYFLAIYILSFSSAFWSIVLTLPNHFRLGSTLADYVGLSYIFYLSGIFCLYIWSRLIVALVLRELLVPSTLPLIFLSGLVELLDLLPFLNFPCKALLFLVKPFYFLDIVENIYYITKLSKANLIRTDKSIILIKLVISKYF